MIERFGLDEDVIRAQIMEWLAARTHDGAGAVTWAELRDFTLAGESLPLKDRVKGIWKPSGFSSALSITTTFRPEGAERPYDDGVIDKEILLRYKWNGTDPNEATNRALRAAMDLRAPLIWFVGIAKGLFQPYFPVYVVGEEPEGHQFLVSADAAELGSDSYAEEHIRRYLDVKTRHRLFQGIFRTQVLLAYRQRCAVCNLGHPPLLDAAHIVPDRDEAGIASVVNGMAMCKIHHAAFDSQLLGIRPDLVVQIKADLLLEIDGPMLKYGLQEMHGRSLMSVPTSRSLKPRLDLLEMAWERFKAG
ncbi:HNH endonuclease signature motif containing protein [Sinomonas sp. ASV486]|uniref:HNH endonuclease n=1 Tax=Sinomonas sp. ASV486 TaxID=3051170 RepID=UPI0027DC845D|nr:HNH endonuclease signature motif containing protein [Sinomonas sp. ASV486]MDQ4491588.1 HNH endonuclease signature motif containing protein [Sinomonas sp. ASV486]